MTLSDSASGHRTFHEKLDLLKHRLLEMSQRAEELLALSVQSYRQAPHMLEQQRRAPLRGEHGARKPPCGPRSGCRHARERLAGATPGMT